MNKKILFAAILAATLGVGASAAGFAKPERTHRVSFPTFRRPNGMRRKLQTPMSLV